MYYYVFLCYLLSASITAHLIFHGFRDEGVPPEKMNKDEWYLSFACCFIPGVNLVVIIALSVKIYVLPLLRLLVKERKIQILKSQD